MIGKRHLVLAAGLAMSSTAANAQNAEIATEKQFIDVLTQMPDEAFREPLERTFQDFGCIVDFNTTSIAFGDRLAQNAAEAMLYSGPITQDSVTTAYVEITDIWNDMEKQGQITRAEDLLIVTLENCA